MAVLLEGTLSMVIVVSYHSLFCYEGSENVFFHVALFNHDEGFGCLP